MTSDEEDSPFLQTILEVGLILFLAGAILAIV
jgi:hypothetical protein